MFEDAGWCEAEQLLGPVPLAPSADWSVDELVTWARRAPMTGAWLDALMGVDRRPLSTQQRLTLLQAWERIRRGVDAEFIATAGTIDRQRCPELVNDRFCPGGASCGHDWAKDDVAAALHLATVTADALLVESRELSSRLVDTLHAVADGNIASTSARRLAMRLAPIIDDATVAVVQERALRAGPTMTPGGLDRLVISTIDRLRDPAEVLAAHVRARRERSGITAGSPQDEGMGSAIVTGSAEEIALILEWARQITVRNRAKGDTRTVGERRVEALLQALTGEVVSGGMATADESDAATGPSTGGSPITPANDTAPAEGSATTPTEAAGGSGGSGGTAGGSGGTAGGAGGAGGSHAAEAGPAASADPDYAVALRPQAPISLRLVMTLESLLGLDESPAWLQGHGNLSAAIARQLAVQPETIQRMVLDAVGGQLLDLGRNYRLANQKIADFVRARDPVCDGLGCNYGSQHCELDHEVPWSEGGSTSAENTRPRCPHHHHSREAGWEPARGEGGWTTWRTASGMSYQTMPAAEMDIKLDWDPLDPRPHWSMQQSPPAVRRRSLLDALRGVGRSEMPGATAAAGPADSMAGRAQPGGKGTAGPDGKGTASPNGESSGSDPPF